MVSTNIEHDSRHNAQLNDTSLVSIIWRSCRVDQNGTCYLEVVANPEHVLRETSNANDVSLRKIIISGKRGYRDVFVPPRISASTTR